MNNEEQSLDRHYVLTLEHRIKQLTEQQNDDAELLDWLESHKGDWTGWEVEINRNGSILLIPSNRYRCEIYAPTMREAIRMAMESEKR